LEINSILEANLQVTKIDKTTKIKNDIIFEDEFPKNNLDNYPKEDLCNKFLLTSFGIVIFFLIFGLKFFISEILQIPTFCDLREN